MSQSDRSGLLPRLRFPEFLKEGPWVVRPLGEIAELVTNRIGNREATLLSITTGVGLVSQEEKFGREIAGAARKNYFSIKINDFAYNKSATKEYPQGQIALNANYYNAAVPNSIFTCFRANSANVVPAFLKYLFARNHHGQWLQNFITVGARAHGSLQISNDDLLSMPIPLPGGPKSLEEQEKIVEVLEAIDELIEGESQKLDALKDHKQALMQQLFPSEGESLPSRRLPEFRREGDWQQKKLAVVGEIVTGSTPSTSSPENYGDKWQFVSPGDISDGRFIEDTTKKLSDIGFSAARMIAPNSILFVCIGSTIGKVAQNRSACATNQQINAVIPSKNFSHEFIYFLLERKSVLIAEEAGQQAVPIINKSQFSDILIRFPILAEQKRIAEVLSSIEAVVSAQSQKVHELKKQKLGLLQQLFPAFDEVQG